MEKSEENKEPKVGLSDVGAIVVKNRAYRRNFKNTAQTEGKMKRYYTKKHGHKRVRHGKAKFVGRK